MMLECNLKLLVECFCLANASKITRKSTHGTRLCGVAQDILTYCSHHGRVWTGANQLTYSRSHDIRYILYLVILYLVL